MTNHDEKTDLLPNFDKRGKQEEESRKKSLKKKKDGEIVVLESRDVLVRRPVCW
jgi:hypothetical protein